MTHRRPGFSGIHSLVMTGPFEKVDASNFANRGTLGSSVGVGSGVGSTLGDADGSGGDDVEGDAAGGGSLATA
ncbi:MAG TPA: hypothetical protein VF253_07560 [Candidatus Limnocylindrales bacterium]